MLGKLRLHKEQWSRHPWRCSRGHGDVALMDMVMSMVGVGWGWEINLVCYLLSGLIQWLQMCLKEAALLILSFSSTEVICLEMTSASPQIDAEQLFIHRHGFSANREQKNKEAQQSSGSFCPGLWLLCAGNHKLLHPSRGWPVTVISVLNNTKVKNP